MWQLGFGGRIFRSALWAAAAACFALTGLLWYGALTGEEPAGMAQRADGVPLAPLPGLILAAPPPPEAYKPVLDRPLFHPGRLPFAERSVIAAATAERNALAAQAAKAPAPAPPPVLLPPPQGVTFRGTIISGPFRSAIFERTGRKDYVRVEEGGVLDGWTLAKITRSEIQLRANGQDLELKLDRSLR
jgi:hypothetical protein